MIYCKILLMVVVVEGWHCQPGPTHLNLKTSPQRAGRSGRVSWRRQIHYLLSVMTAKAVKIATSVANATMENVYVKQLGTKRNGKERNVMLKITAILLCGS